MKIFLSLGSTPLTDAYVPLDQAQDSEPRYPLDLAFCEQCSLVQILFTVPPAEMFEEYFYYSSFSTTLEEHSREHVHELIKSRGLGPDNLVVEIASNDGYLLRHFVDAGVPVLGIDPARGPAEAANAVGIPTLQKFFSTELATGLRSEGRRADVLIAKNVLGHVPDVNSVVEGIHTILNENGIAEIEVPYLKDLIDHVEFDTIYHEHLCYFSVTALDALFKRNDMYLNQVRHFPIHGGSLRLTVAHQPDVTDSVNEYLAAEAEAGMDSFSYYQGFADRVTSVQKDLRALIERLKADGARIAAYGAAAKGTILLDSSGIGNDLIDFVGDKSTFKQGKFLPGLQIPILPPSALMDLMPDYVVLLAWNFKDEILREQNAYLDAGGKFIIPIPTPVIIDS